MSNAIQKQPSVTCVTGVDKLDILGNFVPPTLTQGYLSGGASKLPMPQLDQRPPGTFLLRRRELSPLPQTKEPLSKSKGEIGVKSTKDKDEYIFSSEQDVDSFPFNMHEYEEGMSKRSVKGSLKMHAQFWYDIGAYRSVLDIIEHGYVIPFVKIPSPACFRNNSSATRHADFVTKAIQELLEDGRIIESKFVPSVVNPLSVSVNETGKNGLF